MKLVKEIRSKDGVLHFQRWEIFSCSLFSIYLHKIHQPDNDKHLHNHPWNFFSVILAGTYTSKSIKLSNLNEVRNKRGPLSFGYMSAKDSFHKIESIEDGPVTTLVVTGSRNNNLWGYYMNPGFKTHSEYRTLKNNNGI